MTRIAIAVVALVLLTGGSWNRRNKPSPHQSTQEQSVKSTGGDTSNTNIAVPPSPERSDLLIVSLVCDKAKAEKKVNHNDELCEIAMENVRNDQCANSPICTGPPFWFRRWPFIGPYCC